MQVDDLLGAIWLPGDGKVNPTDLTQSLAKGARQRRRPDRRAGAGDRLRPSRTAGGRGSPASAPTSGDVECEVVVNCAGQWAQGARRPGRRHRAAALGRALLRRHRGGRGHPPGPADHARPGRLDVLQGGGRRPGRRRLRARGEAVALAGRPAAPVRVPAARGGLGALLGADGRGAAPDPGAGRDRHPEVLQRAGVVHARQPVPARRGARSCDGFFVGAGFNSVGIASAGGAGRALAEWIVAGEPTRRPGRRSTSAGSRRSTPTTRWLRDRVAEVLGLHYAVPWPNRELGHRAATSGARPLHDRLAAAGRGVRHQDGLGAAATSSRPRRVPTLEYAWGKPSWLPWSAAEQRACRTAVAVFDQTSFSKYVVAGPRRARGAAVGVRRRRRRRRSGTASTRRSSTSAAPTRPT